MKFAWNFKLFYKSESDPQIDRDLKRVKLACKKFNKKYSSSLKYLSSNKALLEALNDYEKIYFLLNHARPLMYYYYKNSINSADAKIQIKLNDLINKYANYQSEVIFFTNNLKKIKPTKQKEFLKSKDLKKYHYFLICLFREGKYSLSNDAERVINLKFQPAHFMWVTNNEKYLNQQIVIYKRRAIPVNQAIAMLGSLKLAERRGLHKKINEKFNEILDISAAELNAVLTNKKIDDDLRGFREPYDSRILSDQLDDKIVSGLVKTVSSNFKLSHVFYKVKKQALNLSEFFYEDRNAELGNYNRKITFSQALKILDELYSDLNPELSEKFKSFLNSGQVDVYPRQGKTGGAYCSSTPGNPTMVLLNQVDNLNSLLTLTHEMGHAFHSDLSKEQPYIYQEYTTATAEVASTLFENLLIDKLIEQANKRDKIILLHNRLNGDVSTIFRQIAFFNFECELHKNFRKKGGLEKQEIVNLLNKHLKTYLGSAINLRGDEGRSVVHIGHFRSFFYVYTYAFGQLISRLLVEKFKVDKSFSQSVQQFLTTGGGQSPEDIFKNMGIDIRDKKTWEKALEFIQRDILNLKKLINEK